MEYKLFRPLVTASVELPPPHDRSAECKAIPGRLLAMSGGAA